MRDRRIVIPPAEALNQGNEIDDLIIKQISDEEMKDTPLSSAPMLSKRKTQDSIKASTRGRKHSASPKLNDLRITIHVRNVDDIVRRAIARRLACDKNAKSMSKITYAALEEYLREEIADERNGIPYEVTTQRFSEMYGDLK